MFFHKQIYDTFTISLWKKYVNIVQPSNRIFSRTKMAKIFLLTKLPGHCGGIGSETSGGGPSAAAITVFGILGLFCGNLLGPEHCGRAMVFLLENSVKIRKIIKPCIRCNIPNGIRRRQQQACRNGQPIVV